MGRTWKCAVVGTGMVGEVHLRVISEIPNARLAAVCNPTIEKARAALARLNLANVPAYSEVEAMLASEPIDVVCIATPSGAHLESAVVALRAGKNVISEKPIEIKIERVDAMIETAKRHGARIGCIFQNRWREENVAIKQAVQEGRFGRLAWAGSFTPWYRPDEYYEKVKWRGTWKLDGGGAVMNQGIHSIDLLQWIAGPVRSVSAYGGKRVHDSIEVEDTMSASFEFENGAYGSILCTTALFPGMPARLEIGGENGTAVAENGLKMFKFRDERPGDADLMQRLAPPDTTTGGAQSNAAAIPPEFHARNIRSILAAWDEDRDADTSGAEARKAVAIILAMYESTGKGGAPVKVERG